MTSHEQVAAQQQNESHRSMIPCFAVHRNHLSRGLKKGLSNPDRIPVPEYLRANAGRIHQGLMSRGMDSDFD